MVLCSGGATIHDIPGVLDCLHHPGTAATLQPHEAERGRAQEEPRGPLHQSDRISFWYL